jgi:hypothetical protein
MAKNGVSQGVSDIETVDVDGSREALRIIENDDAASLGSGTRAGTLNNGVADGGDPPTITITGQKQPKPKLQVKLPGLPTLSIISTPPSAGTSTKDTNGGQCTKASAITVGGGYSGTLFAGILGVSAGANGTLSISSSGVQFTGTISITPLAGFGAFAGFGPSGNFGSQQGSAHGVYTSSNTVIQLGAGDGGGVEVGGNLDSSTSYNVSMGPRGAIGVYGAFGKNFSKNVTVNLIGCH